MARATKNHFYIAYSGNKRDEAETTYDKINFEGITTIIEPFCGSCAISYYINTRKEGLKYILNDDNENLKKMYELMQDDEKIEEFETEYRRLTADIDKAKYNTIIKDKTLMAWFIKNNIYAIRQGLFPLKLAETKKDINLREKPIFNFFRNADIEFHSMNGVDLVEQYKDNPECLLYIDPPYINTCNQYYDYGKGIDNIYEYLYYNPIDQMTAKIVLTLENNYIIIMLFNKFIKETYDKKYQTSKKRQNTC